MPLPRLQHPNPYRTLEELVQAPEERYQPPVPPSFDEDLKLFEKPAMKYGHEILSSLFTLDPTITLLNHGSYGSCSKPVQDIRNAYSALQEFEPVKFMEDYIPRIARVNRILAKYVNASPEQIVIVPNASSASTSVLRSFPFPPNSTIISFDLEYGAVIRQMNQFCAGLKQHVIKTSPPFTASSILTALNQGLAACEGETIGLVVVDHITSESGLILPIQEIVAICKKRNIPVLVDGAHAIGQVPLNLNELQPDFYLSNLHKWILAPKSSAFLYIRDPKKYNLQPPIISHGHTIGTSANFGFIGTMDYSAYLAIPASLAFHEKMGGHELMQRNHELCVAAAQKLAKSWNTQLLTPEVDTMIGSICVVQLPHDLFQDHDHFQQDLLTLHLVLREQYHIEVKTTCVGGAPGLRISAQMYNEESDYDRLEVAILDILKRDASELQVKT